jgi:hypothetical protein
MNGRQPDSGLKRVDFLADRHHFRRDEPAARGAPFALPSTPTVHSCNLPTGADRFLGG